MSLRQKLDDLGSTRGWKLRIYFPHGGALRIMTTTGNSRPHLGRAPCACDWELKDETSGQLEWVPGWYLASRAK